MMLRLRTFLERLFERPTVDHTNGCLGLVYHGVGYEVPNVALGQPTGRTASKDVYLCEPDWNPHELLQLMTIPVHPGLKTGVLENTAIEVDRQPPPTKRDTLANI